MTSGGLSQRVRGAAAWLFALLGLGIPISTAADSLLVGLIVIAWLMSLPQSLADTRRLVLSVKPVLLAVVLFALVLIGATHGEAGAGARWSGAIKYADLLLIPVLLWAARARPIARTAVHMFLLAIALNLILSYAMANFLTDPIPGLRTTPYYPVGFRMSVTHNVFVAFGAFVCLLVAREAKTRSIRLAMGGLAVLCAHNVLFIVIGRTGYLLLGLLFGYFILLSLPGWRRKSLAFILIAGLFAAAYYGSDNLQSRLTEIRSDIGQWNPGAADKTSVGQRMEYALTTLRIIAEHPLAGVGTGGFTGAYQRATTSELVTTNPHNDYLMLGAQIGVPGIVLLLALYVLLWWDAGRLPSRFERDLLRGVVLTLATGGLFHSLLLDHVEGLFFAWVVALAYAGRSPASAQPLKAGPV